LCYEEIISICLVVISGCTVTNYDGKIYPTTVEFNKANFKYIKTIKGVSEATYDGFGGDKKQTDGLISEAKYNMYNQHPLKENQVPTNLTVDVLRERDPNQLRKVRVVITADIFEFSNNGTYFSKTEYINENNIDESNNKTIENHINNLDLSKFKKGYPRNLFTGDLVIVNLGGIEYLGSVGRDVGAYDKKVKLKQVCKKNEGNEKWTFEKSEALIPINLITHYKPH
jgi:hypothetical protein